MLRILALEDTDFDVDGRGKPSSPLDDTASRSYLANPSVLHWVAWEADTIAGFLLCHVIALRVEEPRELLLYEIGVRAAFRRRGVGKALVDTMTAWMDEEGVGVVWVCADNPGAVAFYRACGFDAEAEQPVYMTRSTAR